MPAAPVDPVVWLLGRRGEESFPAHTGGAGPNICSTLLQECSGYSRKRLRNTCDREADVITMCLKATWREMCIISKILFWLSEICLTMMGLEGYPFHFQQQNSSTKLFFDSVFYTRFFRAAPNITSLSTTTKKRFLSCFHHEWSSAI